MGKRGQEEEKERKDGKQKGQARKAILTVGVGRKACELIGRESLGLPARGRVTRAWTGQWQQDSREETNPTQHF